MRRLRLVCPVVEGPHRVDLAPAWRLGLFSQSRVVLLTGDTSAEDSVQVLLKSALRWSASLPWFASIETLQCPEDLTGLPPKRGFIPAQTVKRRGR